MRRVLSALLVASLAVAAGRAQDAQDAQERDPATGLYGRVEADGTYDSPTGTFKIASPVVRELGGTITDTPNVVTFQDDFTTLISIGAFVDDATQKWELSTRGLKDYLVYFFSNFVIPDFRRAFPETRAELDARFSPTLMGGALITFTLLPGGSMFEGKFPVFAKPKTPPVAKRGNMIFVKNGYTFVISTELAERVTEGSEYTKTPQEEDSILRERLASIASKIVFLTTPPAP